MTLILAIDDDLLRAHQARRCGQSPSTAVIKTVFSSMVALAAVCSPAWGQCKPTDPPLVCEMHTQAAAKEAARMDKIRQTLSECVPTAGGDYWQCGKMIAPRIPCPAREMTADACAGINAGLIDDVRTWLKFASPLEALKNAERNKSIVWDICARHYSQGRVCN